MVRPRTGALQGPHAVEPGRRRRERQRSTSCYSRAVSREITQRELRNQRAEAAFDALPFDAAAARAYGRVFAQVHAAGRKARGARAVDLLIAATALGAGLPLYTRNAADLRSLETILDVVSV